jgi:hypothetical protein
MDGIERPTFSNLENILVNGTAVPRGVDDRRRHTDLCNPTIKRR